LRAVETKREERNKKEDPSLTLWHHPHKSAGNAESKIVRGWRGEKEMEEGDDGSRINTEIAEGPIDIFLWV
jgi:hypothetical protein